jgi:hypothetical protein
MLDLSVSQQWNFDCSPLDQWFPMLGARDVP